ncbi:MAG: sulfatase-like hydrolase/transferase [Planctomycetaceae bacterium]|nr:sulfatase-like hydrolase/transferase [Planctomycetaceae bacterium]
MNGLTAVGIVWFLTSVALPADQSDSGASRFGKPNIIILLADDLGYGELGCQGNSEIPTPSIDSIAQDGIRLTAGYVTAPNCSPSRAGLLTGRFPTRFGHEFNPTGAKNEDPAFGLPLSQRTIADALQGAGYITGLIGKWHLGGTAAYHPYRRGFDEFFGFLHEGHYYVPDPWNGVTTMLRRRMLPGGGQGRRMFGNVVYGTHLPYNEPDYDANNPIVRGSQPVSETAYLTDAWTREAVDFIGRHRNKPFFLLVAYNAVHSPLQGADAYMERFAHVEDIQRRIFTAMLANLDDSVGAVRRKLHDENLEGDTLIVFLSDNGGPTRELTSSNRPLRGEKGQMYEGGIRVPFLLAWPGRLPAGEEYSAAVSSVDLHATVLAIAGAQTDAASDGVDLLPFLRREDHKQPHSGLFWRQGTNAAVRVGDWKLLRHGRANGPGEWELYNLADDLSESQDLASLRSEKRDELLSTWKRFDAEMVDPLFR